MSISATSRVSPITPHPMRRAGDFVVDRDRAEIPSATGIDSKALTQTEPPLRSAPASSRMARPDASFVAHLIATAEQVPQTRTLRRAAIADVEAAYRAAGAYAGGSTQHRTQLSV
jgi:hypothetical protein